jgi:L-amino acid N-acyltransferase YncA
VYDIDLTPRCTRVLPPPPRGPSSHSSECTGVTLKTVIPSGVTIRAAEPRDAAAVAAIYNHYVEQTIVTFEEEPVSSVEMARRIEEVRDDSLPWLVAEQDGHIVGYASSRKWKSRSAYRFAVEVTVYVAPESARSGIGSSLYGGLFPMLQARGIHAVIAGIALPNEASVALHEKFGMRKVAHFPQVGFKFGRWIDVGYWQRTF